MMSNINVDTVKLRDCGKDILSEVNTYEKNIKNLFSRMANVPTQTKEWEGLSAEKYAKIVASEEKEYVNYGNGLKELGNALVDYSYDLEKAIKNTKIT